MYLISKMRKADLFYEIVLQNVCHYETWPKYLFTEFIRIDFFFEIQALQIVNLRGTLKNIRFNQPYFFQGLDHISCNLKEKSPVCLYSSMDNKKKRSTPNFLDPFFSQGQKPTHVFKTRIVEVEYIYSGVDFGYKKGKCPKLKSAISLYSLIPKIICHIHFWNSNIIISPSSLWSWFTRFWFTF